MKGGEGRTGEGREEKKNNRKSYCGIIKILSVSMIRK